MTSIWKRSLSAFLAFVMVFGMVPVNAFATETEEVAEEVLVEEVFEEEIFEEEIVEEIFEEEVFEEEVFEEEVYEEELVEEIFEEEALEEDVPEETVKEEPVEEEVVEIHVSDDVANAAAEYIIWLNVGDQDNEIRNLLIGENGIKNAILDAVLEGEYDPKDYTVTYDGEDVTGAGHASGFITGPMWFAQEKASVLEAELKNNGNVATFYVNGVGYAIQFRDNRLKIHVAFENPGNIQGNAAEYPIEQLKQYLEEQIGSITADDPTTMDVVEELAVDVPYEVTFSDVCWSDDPIDAYTVVKMTVTIDAGSLVYDDDTFVHKTTFRLMDNRGRYQVIYNVDGVAEAPNYLIAGQATPAWDVTEPDLVPTKDLYTFWGWDADPDWTPSEEKPEPAGVSATVDSTVTYYAFWKAKLDKNGNNVADQEETYTIEFDVDGEVTEVEAAYGEYLADVAEQVTAEKDGWNFDKWVDADNNDMPVKVEAPDSTDGNTTWHYYATWTEYAVVTFKAPYDAELGYKYENFRQPVDGSDWEAPVGNVKFPGYYVEKWLKDGAEYNFDQEITVNITLEPVFFVDRNNNGRKDATADDPLTKYSWIVDGAEVAYVDHLEGEDAIVLTGANAYYKYKEVAKDNRVFAEWLKTETKTEDGSVITVTFTASFDEDTNNNEKNDDDEIIMVNITGDAAGTVTIDGDEVIDGETYVYDQDLGAEIKAVVTEENGYVKSILLGEEEVAAYADGAAEAVLTHEQIMDADRTITITFGKVDVSEGTATITPADTYTAEAVFDAVTGGIAAENKSAEYLAREATVQVDVSRLASVLEAKLFGLMELDDTMRDIFKYYGYEYNNGCITYTYASDEVWTPIAAAQRARAAAGTLSAQEAVDNYLNDLNGKSLQDLIEDAGQADAEDIATMMFEVLDMLIGNMETVIEANGYHTFGAQATETVNVSSDRLSLNGVALSISGADNEILVKDLQLPYGTAITAETLLNGATSMTTVELKTDANMTEAGDYVISLYAPAGNGYKAASATYTLTITPVDPALKLGDGKGNVVNMSGYEAIVVKEGEDYASHVAPSAKTDVIHVIAGLDMGKTQVKPDLSSEYKINLNGTTPVVRMYVPESIQELIDLFNKVSDEDLNLKSGTVSLSSISDMMKKFISDAEQQKKIDKAINLAQDLLGSDAEVELIVAEKPDEIYPEVPGVYVNLGAVMDTNYTTAMAYQMMLVGTVLPVPNKGLTLTVNGSAEHLAEVEYGTDYTVAVTGHESCTSCQIRYYTITLGGAKVSETQPTDKGLYLVAAQCCDADGKIVTDSVVMLIDEDKPSVMTSINSDVIDYDGNAHSAEIVVTDENGSTVTDAAVSVITAAVDMQGKLVSVNVDLPKKVDEILADYGYSFPENITPAEFVEKVEGIHETVMGYIPEALTEMIGADKVDGLVGMVTGRIAGLVAEGTELRKLLDKAEGNIKVTFDHDVTFTEPGIYVYAAAVTDPDYSFIPAVEANKTNVSNIGYLIIEDPNLAVDDLVVSVGEEYTIESMITNGTGFESVYMISGNGNWYVYLDDDAQALVDKLNGLVAKFSDKKIELGKAYDLSKWEEYDLNDLADALVEKIFDYLLKKAENEFGAGTMGKAAEFLLDAAESGLNKYKGKLINLVKEELTKLDTNRTLTIYNKADAELPTEKGTYKVRAVTYAPAYDEGVLKITAAGSIRIRSAALDLLNKVSILYKASDDLVETDNAEVKERGIFLYSNLEDAKEKDPTKAIETIELEWNETEQRYMGYSEGIDARDMGVSRFAVAYILMNDGTYVFGTKLGEEQCLEYSPLIYCRNKKNDPTIVGDVCAALMQYGAAAQIAQYNEEDRGPLMNVGFKDITYDEAVLGTSIYNVETDVINGIKIHALTLDLHGAISYVVKYTTEGDEMVQKTLYAEYSLLNKTGVVELKEGTDGRLWAVIEGVVPKDLDAKLTVKAYYLDENGEKVYAGSLDYSAYEYVRRAQTNTKFSEADKALARALGMYIDYANQYAAFCAKNEGF